jgi:hypothetical protein
MGAHHGHEEPWVVFDFAFAFGNIKLEIPPVAPLIVGIGN